MKYYSMKSPIACRCPRWASAEPRLLRTADLAGQGVVAPPSVSGGPASKTGFLPSMVTFLDRTTMMAATANVRLARHSSQNRARIAALGLYMCMARALQAGIVPIEP